MMGNKQDFLLRAIVRPLTVEVEVVKNRRLI